MSTTTLAFATAINNTATDVASVVLSDPTGTFGVRRTDTNALVVADSTPFVHVGTGNYSYTFTDPAPNLLYEYWITYVVNGETFREQRFSRSPSIADDNLVSLARVRRLPSMARITDDNFVNDVIAAVSGNTRKWCNRKFTVESGRVDYYDGDGTDELILRGFPLLSLNSIQAIPFGGGDNITLATADMVWYEHTSVVKFHHRNYTGSYTYFPRGSRNLIVNYDCGFTTIPDAVQQGVALWVSEVCLKSLRDPSLASETLGKHSWEITQQSEIEPLQPPPAARVFLARYRDLRV